MDLTQIAEELSSKFTSHIYAATAVLSTRRPNGDTLWRIEYTAVATGQRVPEYDGLIRRTDTGVTYAL